MSPEEMAALHARVFTSHPAAWSAAAFSGLLAEPSVFALEGAGAFLLARVVADEAELLTLAVAPE
ncbi:MAG: ribosomal-protein-alanine acetyltransferase, partial [Alphaproteobacteria bacterium]